MTSLYFNKAFYKNMFAYCVENNTNKEYNDLLVDKSNSLQFFDARAFNLQKEEVNNYFVWRQQDAIKNAIQMIGRAYFSHKELENKNGKDIVDMLDKIHINYHSYSTSEKRGTCCIKTEQGWVLDKEIPVFKDNKYYIEHSVYVGE